MTIDPYASALDLAAAIKAKELSPVETVQAYLDRIDKYDGEINAFVTVVGDEALAAARAAERAVGGAEDLPPFHGVPIPIKDLCETAGIRTTHSSRAVGDHVPEIDASVVRRIREAGFIIIGKTNASEFGTMPVTESVLNGDCRNPWDTSRTPGGSSGGAGAALAAGMSPLAHGSDGGGSVRIPASCCGIYGIKPARGRISQAPFVGESWAGYSTDGPLARSVADAAALLDVMSGYEWGDPYWAPEPERPFRDEVGRDPGRLKVGFVTTAPTGVPVAPACVAAATEAARLLESLGHEIVDIPLEEATDEIASHFIKIVQTSTAYYRGLIDIAKVEQVNRALAEAGRATSSMDYIEARLALQDLSRRVLSEWETIDVLLTPTLALPPVEVGWMFEPEDPWEQLVRAGMFMPFTPVANITGQPAVSLPLYWTDDLDDDGPAGADGVPAGATGGAAPTAESADGGAAKAEPANGAATRAESAANLPIGIQLVGGPADEATLIRLSAQLEEARPWKDRAPPGF